MGRPRPADQLKPGAPAILPFALRRPWLLLRDACLDRDRPPLERLRREGDPERFVWDILPHAARTFSACIVLLPAATARAAAVGYLYCRILDTCEDLHPDEQGRRRTLRAFAGRLQRDEPGDPPGLPQAEARDARDRAHLLLVERCRLVDAVFADLPGSHREAIRDLVAAMAEAMCWASETFARQGGVLVGEQQLLRYCHGVLGHPVEFATRLLSDGAALPAALRDDAMVVGELVQLANVTRDLEKDLARGVAYDERLRPWLGAPASDGDVIRQVRRDLTVMALQRAPAYRRMLDQVDLRGPSLARASALLMLLFTSRHYRSCARRTGLVPWGGPDSAFGLVLRSLPAALSRRYADRAVRRVERDFLAAAAAPPTAR